MTAHPPIEVDARGLRCPLPVLRLAQALAQHAAGTTVRLEIGRASCRERVY